MLEHVVENFIYARTCSRKLKKKLAMHAQHILVTVIWHRMYVIKEHSECEGRSLLPPPHGLFFLIKRCYATDLRMN